MADKLRDERIRFIDHEIRAGRYPNAGQLAREFGVTDRTIRRVIDHMKDCMDAPIEYDSSKRGYYYTEDNFFLPFVDIKESEFFAICISEKALKQYENTPFYDRLAAVFEKIKGFLPDTIRVNTTWIDTHYTFLQESYTNIQPEIWESVAASLRSSQQLRISHQKAGETKATMRTVDPYHIVSYRGEWYLIGFCHTRKDVLRFAVSRIKSARLLDKGYEIQDGFSIDEFLGSAFGIMSDSKEYRVKIRFSQEQAPYILERQWHASQSVKENRDGTVDLSFNTSSLFEVKRWVLSWGADAVVLGPRKLVNAVRDEIKSMAGAYGN